MNPLTPSPDAPGRSVEIDLAAIRHNVATIKQKVAPAELLSVVKADGYGHGALPVAVAARQGGADLIGTAHLAEAIKLRQQGFDGPLIAWLHTPDAPFEEALVRDIRIGCSGWDLFLVIAAAKRANLTATVHLKLDTGLGRNGCSRGDWEKFFKDAAEAVELGYINVEGLFSHLAVAEDLEHPATEMQLDAFDAALELAESYGLKPRYRHIANTAGALGWPGARHNLVRVGLGTYGLSPFDEQGPEDLDLIPAMTVRARIANIKAVPTGHGVSYGLRYQTTADCNLALIPLGYADGIPRPSWQGPVLIEDKIYHSAGTVAMDQFVVDLSEHPDNDHIKVGHEAVLFGPPPAPSATEWALAAGTINYEIATRISVRGPRRYHNAEYRFDLENPEQTQQLAQQLAALLKPGDGIILVGELGAGKTTFTQGLAAGLGIAEQITSPTFVLARQHRNDEGTPLVHVDAYRLESTGELYDLDLEESIPESVTVIEWGKDKAEELFSSYLEIELVRAVGSPSDTTDFSEEDVAEPRQVIIRPFGYRFTSEQSQQDLAGLLKENTP